MFGRGLKNRNFLLTHFILKINSTKRHHSESIICISSAICVCFHTLNWECFNNFNSLPLNIIPVARHCIKHLDKLKKNIFAIEYTWLFLVYSCAYNKLNILINNATPFNIFCQNRRKHFISQTVLLNLFVIWTGIISPFSFAICKSIHKA